MNIGDYKLNVGHFLELNQRLKKLSHRECIICLHQRFQTLGPTHIWTQFHQVELCTFKTSDTQQFKFLMKKWGGLLSKMDFCSCVVHVALVIYVEKGTCPMFVVLWERSLQLFRWLMLECIWLSLFLVWWVHKDFRGWLRQVAYEKYINRNSITNQIYQKGCVLTELGALYAPEIVHHFQFWRLATNMFLHGGFLHIAMNMYVQLLSGLRCEYEWGTKITGTIYCLSGLGGSLFSAVASPYSLSGGSCCAQVFLFVCNMFLRTPTKLAQVVP